MTIKTKFNIGDEVMFIRHNKAVRATVTHIWSGSYSVHLLGQVDDPNAVFRIPDHNVFKTKEELIESLFS